MEVKVFVSALFLEVCNISRRHSTHKAYPYKWAPSKNKSTIQALVLFWESDIQNRRTSGKAQGLGIRFGLRRNVSRTAYIVIPKIQYVHALNGLSVDFTEP